MQSCRNLKPNIQYGTVSFMYFLGLGVTNVFQTVFLVQKGFSYSYVGFAMAAIAVLTIVMQSAPAAWSDRHYRCSQKSIMLIYSFVDSFLALVLLVLPDNKPLIFSVFILMLGLNSSMASVIYAYAMEFINYGQPIQFSILRALGSFSYALISPVAGLIMERWSCDAAILSYALISAITGTATALSHNPRLAIGRAEFERRRERLHPNRAEKAGYIRFFKKYHVFLLILGYFLFNCADASVYNFMYPIMNNIGGSETDLGLAMGIGAFFEIPFMMVFPRIRKHFPIAILLWLPPALLAFKIFLIFLAPTALMVVLAQILHGPYFATWTLASAFHINSIAGEDDKAKGQALLGITANGFSGIFANIFFGRLIDMLGVHSMLAVCVGFAAAGALCIFIYTIRRKH